MYTKILVPIDGSELAEAPLGYAKELATRSGAELILLHVCGPEECHCGPEECHIQPMHRVYVEHTADMLRHRFQESEAARVEISSVILAGSPAREILRYVEENEVSLIVMATHARSGIRQWVMGSVAVKIHRCSNAPVRIVRSLRSAETAPYDWPERRILALLDGSERAEQLLPYLVDHARMSDAEVTLLRVCEPPLISSDYPEAIMPLTWEEYIKRVTSYQKEQCSLYFDDMEKRLQGMGLKVKSEGLLGNAAEEITNYVTRNQFDLIALTTHARCGIGVWPIGSVADKVIHGTSSPILLVPNR